jgi:hypothetical protein
MRSVLTFWLLVTCAGWTHAAERAGLNELVAMIENVPPWTVAKPKEKEILSSLATLDAFPTATLRDAVAEYVKRREAAGHYLLAEMSKVYLVNRFIFKVPEREGQDVRFFGGWDGVPFTNGVANYMWPLAFGADGSIIMKGRYRGYAGPPYRGLEEFDFFSKRYGRRRNVGW